MLEERDNNSNEDGFDEDESIVLKYALEEFNAKTELGWTLTDLDFIMSFPGPLTRNWFDYFNTYVQSVLQKLEEGKLKL